MSTVRLRNVLVLAATFILIAIMAVPASAEPNAKNQQIEGTGVFVWGESVGVPHESGICAPLDGDFIEYDDLTLRIDGAMTGCWYTLIDETKLTPSWVYQERGREVFVSDNGSTFETTYKFSSKWTPDFEAELHGRCQHPIVEGSGTGIFAGSTGRVDFKDDVDSGIFHYRGHIKMGS